MGAFALPAALIGGGVLSSVFGGRKAPKAPDLPPPPKEQEMLDVIDQISGTQAITVTDGNGKKRRVISRLPRTKEEEALFARAQELMGEATQNLRTLYQKNPSAVADFRPLVEHMNMLSQERREDLAHVMQMDDITDWVGEMKDMQRLVMDREMEDARDHLEEGLSQRGHANSTGGHALRAKLEKEGALARAHNELASREYGERLRADRLKEKMGFYSLSEDERRSELDSAQRGYDLQKEEASLLDAQQQKLIDLKQGQFNLGSGLVGGDQTKAQQGQAANIALTDFNARNSAQTQRYNANIHRLQQGYQNEVTRYQNAPPSFGEVMGSLGTSLGGGMLTAPSGSMLNPVKDALGGGTSTSSPMKFSEFNKTLIQHPSSNQLRFAASRMPRLL